MAAIDTINSRIEGQILHTLMKRRVVAYLNKDLSQRKRKNALVVLGILSKMEGCLHQDIENMKEDIGVYVWELEKRLGLVRPLGVHRHG